MPDFSCKNPNPYAQFTSTDTFDSPFNCTCLQHVLENKFWMNILLWIIFYKALFKKGIIITVNANVHPQTNCICIIKKKEKNIEKNK